MTNREPQAIIPNIMSKTILSGVKPTGHPHIGNLFGMVLPAIELTRQNDDSFLFIANIHDLVKDRQALIDNTYEVAATLLAFGLDPNRTAFYRQSDVPEVFELSSILMNFTAKGLMNRAHAYKAKVDADGNDDNVNMGLYTYPILQAADILTMDTDLVPVGLDQKQHIEIARDIASSFNAVYGDVLKLPEPSIRDAVGTVAGLDGRKMSKSYDNVISLFEPPEETLRKVMKIPTDSLPPDAPKSMDTALYKIMELFPATAALRERYLAGGLGYGDAKKELGTAINEFLFAPRTRFTELTSDRSAIDKLLVEGAARARARAAITMKRVKDAIGL